MFCSSLWWSVVVVDVMGVTLVSGGAEAGSEYGGWIGGGVGIDAAGAGVAVDSSGSVLMMVGGS